MLGHPSQIYFYSDEPRDELRSVETSNPLFMCSAGDHTRWWPCRRRVLISCQPARPVPDVRILIADRTVGDLSHEMQVRFLMRPADW